MNARPVTHPDPEQLQAFALGQLGPAEHDAVASHVMGCAECCQVLRQAPEGLCSFLSGVAARCARVCVGRAFG